MTRGVVLLTAALAAASLGLFAQENSRSSPNPPIAKSAEVRSQNTGSTPGEQNTASPSTTAARGASTPSTQVSAAPQATSARPATAPDPAIGKTASTSNPANEAPAN